MSYYTKQWHSICRHPDITAKVDFAKCGKEEVFNINALLFKGGFNPIA